MSEPARPQEPRARGFEPIADASARVLILGSFPSQASLSAGHYYAHPRNQFWRLVGSALGEDLLGLDWPQRYQALRRHRIALWDVISSCEREGSLDTAIRQAQGNDLSRLLQSLPELRRILFNGATAGAQATRMAEAGFEVSVLPSSSPAHAALTFADKLERWKTALDLDVPPLPAASQPAPAPARRRHRPVEVPITLSESMGVRYLHFGTPWVQGAMLIAKPDLLVLDYVQRMMAWLLFLSPPARVLQLGLGAGALARFVHGRLPASALTVVECSRDVIDVARACFALPADDARLRVVCDDAGAFVARPRQAGRYGVVQVDLYDEHARGPVLDSEAFYRDCRRAMAATGICVVNLFGAHRSFAPNIARLSAAFDGRVMVLPATSAGNRIAMAFQGPALRIEWPTLRERAQWLERRFGWPAVRWSSLLQRASGRAVCEV